MTSTDGLMRKLVTHMMEDPRTITPSLDSVFSIAKAIDALATMPRTWPNA